MHPKPPCPYLSYRPPLNPFGPYLEHLPSLKILCVPQVSCLLTFKDLFYW